MKIFINRQIRRNVPWGGGARFVETMADFLESKNHQIQHHLSTDVDLIIIVDPRSEDACPGILQLAKFKDAHPHVKILYRVNDSDRHRVVDFDKRNKLELLDGLIYSASMIADRVVFISRWLAHEYEKNVGYKLQLGIRDHVVINGCDTNIFHPPERTSDTRCLVRELTDDKLASLIEKAQAPFVRKKLSLVSHHWSDNPLKGLETYRALDEYLLANPAANFEFTYVGRYPFQHYKPQRTNLIQPLAGVALADELRRHDAYVTGAYAEPSGFHDIEGAACGLPVFYHKDGGAIPEKCQHHECSFQFDSSDSLLKHFLPENIENTRKNIMFKQLLLSNRGDIRHFLSAQRMCEEYYKIICDMMV